MKISFTMKTPDIVNVILSGVSELARRKMEKSGVECTKEEAEEFVAGAQQAVADMLRKWFRHGECLDLVLDIDAQTLAIRETGHR